VLKYKRQMTQNKPIQEHSSHHLSLPPLLQEAMKLLIRAQEQHSELVEHINAVQAAREALIRERLQRLDLASQPEASHHVI
jgi:hypothetical protein